MEDKQYKLIQKLSNPIYLGFFQFFKLPGSWFFGINVKSVSLEKGEVTLPFRWSTQNPFRSIYFAALCAAAEFSTGILILVGIEKYGNFSMLVRKFEAEFVKKADSKTTFVCEDGASLSTLIDKSHQTKEPFEITMTSTGYNQNNEVVAIVKVTWGLKARG